MYGVELQQDCQLVDISPSLLIINWFEDQRVLNEIKISCLAKQENDLTFHENTIRNDKIGYFCQCMSSISNETAPMTCVAERGRES